MTVRPLCFECDTCGRSTEESNSPQWYELHLDRNSEIPSLLIQCFHSNQASEVRHYCGLSCLSIGLNNSLKEIEAPSRSELSSTPCASAATAKNIAPVEYVTKWDGDDQAASSICTCSAVSNPACPVHGYEV